MPRTAGHRSAGGAPRGLPTTTWPAGGDLAAATPRSSTSSRRADARLRLGDHELRSADSIGRGGRPRVCRRRSAPLAGPDRPRRRSCHWPTAHRRRRGSGSSPPTAATCRRSGTATRSTRAARGHRRGRPARSGTRTRMSPASPRSTCRSGRRPRGRQGLRVSPGVAALDVRPAHGRRSSSTGPSTFSRGLEDRRSARPLHLPSTALVQAAAEDVAPSICWRPRPATT